MQTLWINKETGELRAMPRMPKWVKSKRAGVLKPNPKVRALFREGWRPAKKGDLR